MLCFPFIAAAAIALIVESLAYSLWMPERLVLPYAAFLVILVSIMSGHIKLLPLAALFTGILIHGYASMPLFTLLPLLVSLLFFRLRHARSDGISKALAPWLWAALIGAVFLAPLVIDLVISSPNNLTKALEAQQQLAGSFKISSIPTLMVFRDNVLLFQQAGALPAAGLEDVVKQGKELDMAEVRKKIAEHDAEHGAEHGAAHAH